MKRGAVILRTPLSNGVIEMVDADCTLTVATCFRDFGVS
jgi:hypothetical protein